MLRMLLPVVLLCGACHSPDFDPAQAHAAYPYDLHTTDTIPVEVFRDGTTISIVNATAQAWESPTIWINQRFSAAAGPIAAGQTLQLDLNGFRDNIGESFPAGGLFTTRRTMPVRLVELQPAPESHLVGFIAIRQTEHE